MKTNYLMIMILIIFVAVFLSISYLVKIPSPSKLVKESYQFEIK